MSLLAQGQFSGYLIIILLYFVFTLNHIKDKNSSEEFFITLKVIKFMMMIHAVPVIPNFWQKMSVMYVWTNSLQIIFISGKMPVRKAFDGFICRYLYLWLYSQLYFRFGILRMMIINMFNEAGNFKLRSLDVYGLADDTRQLHQINHTKITYIPYVRSLHSFKLGWQRICLCLKVMFTE